jgi:hypothetical protein
LPIHFAFLAHCKSKPLCGQVSQHTLSSDCSLFSGPPSTWNWPGSPLSRWNLATALWGMQNEGMSCLFLACRAGEITVPSDPCTVVRVCGWCNYCPRAKVASLLRQQQQPGLPWGRRFSFSSLQGELGLEPRLAQTVSWFILSSFWFALFFLSPVTLLCFSVLFFSLALLYESLLYPNSYSWAWWRKFLLLCHFVPLL